jgi:hypothetical protein
VKDAEGKLKQARQERRAEIRERVRQLRELNEIGEGAAEKEGEADDVADEQEEQHAEVYTESGGWVTVSFVRAHAWLVAAGDKSGVFGVDEIVSVKYIHVPKR